jgi:hypothetical protein
VLAQRYNELLAEREGGGRAGLPPPPRAYQEQMAAAAISRNTLLVAPPGCGKIRMAAMVLDDLWARKPAARAVYLAEAVGRLDCRIYSRHDLSEPARRELDALRPRVRVLEVPIEGDPLEDWFVGLSRRASPH